MLLRESEAQTGESERLCQVQGTELENSQRQRLDRLRQHSEGNRSLERLRTEREGQAQRRDLIVAVSRDLNVSEEDFAGLPGGVFFFKNRIQPGEVVALPEQTAAPPS